MLLALSVHVSYGRHTFSIILRHFGLGGWVAQCKGRRPQLSLTSGFAPLRRRSSTSDTLPVYAAVCRAVASSLPCGGDSRNKYRQYCICYFTDGVTIATDG